MDNEKNETSDLLVNNLIYVSPDPLSLAVQRNLCKNFFQRSTYEGGTGSTARCDLNSGSYYIDPANSYLTFDIQLTGTAPFLANFGIGSAMNCLNQILLRTKSGVEIDRVERANIFSLYETINTESIQYLNTNGSVEGFQTNYLTGNSGGYVYPLNTQTAKRFVLPLKRLSNFFNPVKAGQLLPAAIMSGLSIEIIFEDYRTAFLKAPGAGGTCTGYTISNIALMLDSVTLTDDCQKTLNSISSQSGLELTYARSYCSINEVNTTQVSCQVRKAVSNACYAMAVILNPAHIQDITQDSFASMPFTVSRYQTRLGSLYFPQQPVIATGSEPSVDIEAFIDSKACFNKYHDNHQEGATSFYSFALNAGTICVNLQRDQNLLVSGAPVNNSRVLEMDLNFISALNRSIYVFMVYNCVSRAYLDNTSVGL